MREEGVGEEMETSLDRRWSRDLDIWVDGSLVFDTAMSDIYDNATAAKYTSALEMCFLVERTHGTGWRWDRGEWPKSYTKFFFFLVFFCF